MRSGDVVTATVKERVTTLVGVLGTEADHAAAAELMPLVYDELRALARRYLRAEHPGHTLQPTALVPSPRLSCTRPISSSWTRHGWIGGAEATSGPLGPRPCGVF
jgi:hypothetical protein